LGIKLKKINKNIKASSHSKHYLLHRYWGRKAHNVVNEYIKNYTKKDDLVLDPFMGSGVVPIECSKMHRKAIGVDLNPISTFIVKNTINKIDIDLLEKNFTKIFNKNKKKYESFYFSKCKKCNSNAIIENSVWKEKKFYSIKIRCKKCGILVKKADALDRKLLNKISLIFNKEKNNFYFPKEKILKYVKRSDKTHMDMLFTERALIILGNINKDINEISNYKIRNNLKLCFSSMLSSVSRMIPGDEVKVQGRSGWVVSKLWVPKIHTEKNIFITFQTRFKKFCEGKIEAMNLIDDKLVKIYNKSSENLSFIKSKSIDYIFTDPPYGQSISYFGLSMFWNSWLKDNVNYNKEIIYDPYRNKKYDDYSERLINVFKEMHRVLKDNKHLSLTFHNRDIQIWEIVISNLQKIGFRLENIVYQEQAVSSGTQGLNRKNTFKGDFIYNFKKQSFIRKQKLNSILPVEQLTKQIKKNIKNNKGFITPDKLYEKIIPFIVNNNLYRDENNKIIDIESLLNKSFKYKKLTKDSKIIYGWIL
tara:strand:+ start:2798 stop:4393 length:1596 start_codon:yes stop_codon:yes gene_type:complete